MKLHPLTRLMGAFWLVTSILWAVAAVAGFIYGTAWLEDTQLAWESSITLVDGNLEAIQGMLVETQDVISETENTLDTVQDSFVDLTVALHDLRPLLWKTSSVVTQDVPDALDGIQESMPSVIETAKAVDETLSWLSDFKITIPNPLGDNWEFDLGVNYAPEVPLDQALEGVSDSLEGVPDDLRSMDIDLDTADSNLINVRQDILLLAYNMGDIKLQIGDVNPQLEELNEQVGLLQTGLAETGAGLPDFFAGTRRVFIIILSLTLASQLPIVYLGVVLARGKLPITE